MDSEYKMNIKEKERDRYMDRELLSGIIFPMMNQYHNKKKRLNYIVM